MRSDFPDAHLFLWREYLVSLKAGTSRADIWMQLNSPLRLAHASLGLMIDEIYYKSVHILV